MLQKVSRRQKKKKFPKGRKFVFQWLVKLGSRKKKKKRKEEKKRDMIKMLLDSFASLKRCSSRQFPYSIFQPCAIR